MSQAGGVRFGVRQVAPSQELLSRIRDRLFRSAFVRLSLLYARLTSPQQRKALEALVLSTAVLSLVCLVYLHFGFLRGPGHCLGDVEGSWGREGVLRVEVGAPTTLEESYRREERTRAALPHGPTHSLHSDSFFANGVVGEAPRAGSESDAQDFVGESNGTTHTENVPDQSISSTSDLPPTEVHIMEFSLEHGFLKLNHQTRKKLGVPVHLVTLDPDNSTCFGNVLGRFFVQHVLGYDDVLLLSLKLLAENQKHRGFVRNVVTGSEYIFINVWMDQKSYLTAALLMYLFTVSVSILLRHSHHQIFIFIVWFLHMMEFHSSFHFPAAPLMTVILSLVGLEAVLSEFFQDTSAAFYVILVVWISDQYRSVCCTHRMSRKHWTWWFYLYHFFFYAYTFRFGHNLHLAFFTSWLFILHSMMYFFHRYELPLLLSEGHADRHPGDRPSRGPPDWAPPESASEGNRPGGDRRSSDHRVPDPAEVENLLGDIAYEDSDPGESTHLLQRRDGVQDVPRADSDPSGSPRSAHITDSLRRRKSVQGIMYSGLEIPQSVCTMDLQQRSKSAPDTSDPAGSPRSVRTTHPHQKSECVPDIEHRDPDSVQIPRSICKMDLQQIKNTSQKHRTDDLRPSSDGHSNVTCMLSKRSPSILQNYLRSCIVCGRELFDSQWKCPDVNCHMPLDRIGLLVSVVHDADWRGRNVVSERYRTYSFGCRPTALPPRHRPESVATSGRTGLCAELES